VTYDWKDYRNGGKHKEMSMHAKEFRHGLHLSNPSGRRRCINVAAF